MILRNRVEEEEIVRDPILKTTEKRNGACARFRAVPWSTKETGRGGRRGKKARNRLTMKLQCNDLTAVFHLARLYVAFCPSNHGWILLPFPCKFISSRDSVREYSYVSYRNFYPRDHLLERLERLLYDKIKERTIQDINIQIFLPASCFERIDNYIFEWEFWCTTYITYIVKSWNDLFRGSFKWSKWMNTFSHWPTDYRS